VCVCAVHLCYLNEYKSQQSKQQIPNRKWKTNKKKLKRKNKRERFSSSDVGPKKKRSFFFILNYASQKEDISFFKRIFD